MKKITPIVFIPACLFFANLEASELPDSSFTWTIRSIGWGECHGVSSYMISGDTLIGSKAYKQILVTPDSIFSESNNSYFCAARDSAGLWFFMPGGDSTEYLLYDFNGSMGDTLKINNPWSVGEIDALVISRDSILVKDEYKTRLGIGARQGELWEYWIEDVGSLHGLFYSCHFIFDIGYELSCTYYRGGFISNYGYRDFCGCWTRTSVDPQLNISKLKIYPNPSDGILNLSNQSPEFVSLYFYSAEGRLLDEITLEGKESKQLTSRYSGILIIRIEGPDFRGTQTIQIIKE
jgi:hypothetical protein